MDLSFWLTTVSLLCLAYAVASWAWGQWGPPPGTSVKKKRRRLGFTKRSEGSNVQNAVNAGSEHQGAAPAIVNVQNVQPTIAPPATAAGDAGQPGDRFTLLPRELAQLGEAINLRREGATVEEAVCRAFGVTKGGSENYKRAKALFDAATIAPGAAPAGTFAPTAPPARPRRRRAPTAR